MRARTHPTINPGSPTTWLAAAARKTVLSRLERFEGGTICIEDDWGRYRTRGSSADLVHVQVHSPNFYWKVLRGGSLGAVEAYLDGFWDCDDLTLLFSVFVRELQQVELIESGLPARISQWISRFGHRLRRNNRSGSRRNIQGHYDLGNDLFQAFLDPTMTYSAAFFEHQDATLEQASVAKLDRICRKLQLQPHDHILEIGTGWGSFAIHAAREYGCRVTSTTISQQQFELASLRVSEAGLEDQIELLQEDYRDLRGKYDKLVSIEMIEAVGHEFLPAFFGKCSNLLHPHGQALIQAITFNEQRYERSLRSVDFIQKHIFPGSRVPSLGAIVEATRSASDFRLSHLEDLGLHYARTLRMWRERFNESRDRIFSHGYTERFSRLWNCYLSYCEAGFAERYLGVAQILFQKPLCRNVMPLPSNRALTEGRVDAI